MFKKVDHIAIAVRNLEETKKKMIDLFGAKFIVEKVNTEGQYKVAIMQVGDSTFSFLEPTTPESFVARHLEKFGETMQHLGLEVENLDKFIEHFNAQGLKTSNYAEIPGVRREVLVGPRNPLGVILQVFEWLGEYKSASPEKRMTKVWG